MNQTRDPRRRATQNSDKNDSSCPLLVPLMIGHATLHIVSSIFLESLDEMRGLKLDVMSLYTLSGRENKANENLPVGIL